MKSVDCTSILMEARLSVIGALLVDLPLAMEKFLMNAFRVIQENIRCYRMMEVSEIVLYAHSTHILMTVGLIALTVLQVNIH